MKVVALISGGKDSCFNMVQCVAAGHEIVALANLRPESKDELDSYMYQTVGHQGVELYAEAMGLPLFRQPTQGIAVHYDKVYTPTPADEVEDLYQLLVTVKNEIDFDAVAVGAVLSDYQRIRVENVCSRLGLVALAYLWRRDQGELLQDMINCNIDAIIIKVATLGLDPLNHLGMKISDIQPHLIKMNQKYGLNICGEGGEYETFTLDCPLFTKSVVIEDCETVIHSNDAIAPVGYLNFRKLRLVDKEIDPDSKFIDRLIGFPVRSASSFLTDLEDSELAEYVEKGKNDYTEISSVYDEDNSEINNIENCGPEKQLILKEVEPLPDKATVQCNLNGWCFCGGIIGSNKDIVQATKLALQKLSALLRSQEYSTSDLVAVILYIRDMTSYSKLSVEYSEVIPGPNPPVRVCVETPLSPQTPVLIEAVAYKQPEASSITRHTMHVQSVSHWAPANIGPYSQAVRVGDIVYIAGQIALVPGTMEIVDGGVRIQSKLALRHIGRLIKAMDPNVQIRDVVQGICYVTNAAFISEVRKEWESKTNNSIMDYVVVSQLPRGALVEWQIWAHRGNSRFEYEETGCVIGSNRISVRRRWNYENNVAAIVCYVSAGSSASNPSVCEASCKDEPLTESELEKILIYVLNRLMRGEPPPCTSTCSLRIMYRVGRAPSPKMLYSVIAKLKLADVVTTILPVCQLNNPNIFLSLCALRHE